MKRILTALLVVLLLGTIGYATIERMRLPDALLSTVSVMSLTDIPEGMGAMGKLFTSAMIIGSIIIIAAGINVYLNPPAEGEEMLTDFGASSGKENLMMKEMKVDSRSHLAGQQKAQILERHGLVVVGIKHKGGFEVNVPMKTRMKNGSSILVLGPPAAMLRAEKKQKR